MIYKFYDLMVYLNETYMKLVVVHSLTQFKKLPSIKSQFNCTLLTPVLLLGLLIFYEPGINWMKPSKSLKTIECDWLKPSFVQKIDFLVNLIGLLVVIFVFSPISSM